MNEINEKNSEFEIKARYDFHKFVMDYLQASIRLADLKISLVLGIIGFASPAFVHKWNHLIFILAKNPWETGYLYYLTLMFITTCFYIASLAFAISVFQPRIPTNLNKGYIFFLDILGHQYLKDYVSTAKVVSSEQLLESVLHQNWVLAQIVTKKFRHVSYSITWGVLWIILLIFCVILIPVVN